jgi:hypothetical protein
MLSQLFGRRILCICQPTYGMPLDLLSLCLQRCGLGMLAPASRARRNLYLQMRCALLDDSMRRVVVLCHNDGAVACSQAVAQLCADLPRDRMAKLEIYTFGAAACEFVLPMMDKEEMMMMMMKEDDMAAAAAADEKKQMPAAECDSRGVHVEHFAMTSDPFAQMGVMHCVKRDMESRFCGSVFVINDRARCSACSAAKAGCCGMGMMMPSSSASPMMMSCCNGMMMEDYMMALFPAQMMMMAMGMKPSMKMMMSNNNNNGTGMNNMMNMNMNMGMTMGMGCMMGSKNCICGSAMEMVMAVDRDCAEKREIAAIGSYHAASQAKKQMTMVSCSSPREDGGKRLSWTGLAAAAAAGMACSPGAQSNGMTAGMAALEMARSACRSCEGRMAKEVSWLPRYMCGEAKTMMECNKNGMRAC